MRAPGVVALEDAVAGARFLLRLPSFLRHPIDPRAAAPALRRRLDRREPDFLGLVKRLVYDNPVSPYRTLLAHAGCSYGDLERLVTGDGVEGALGRLLRAGVYLTGEEARGRRPIVRGSTTFTLDPAGLRPPGWAFHVPVQSSGSRGTPTPVRNDLRWLRHRGVDGVLALDARGGLAWDHAVWAVPGGAAVSIILRYSLSGTPPVRWFSQIDPDDPELHARYRWSARALRWGGRLAGVRLPRPCYVRLDDPGPIVRWMADVLARGGTPHLDTFVSSAVRLCQAALDSGVGLPGAQFTVAGEPVTAARLAVIRRVGAEAASYYACAGVGIIGFWCLTPEVADEIHLLHDLCAIVQWAGAERPPDLAPLTLFVSSLAPTAPRVLLNVSLGDQAVVTRRSCGCALERLGWATHLHTIRSDEKVTVGGMTFPDADVIRVLEEVLPARFGGVPTDYQLVEQQGDDARTPLRLLVSPALGPLDPGAVAETFLEAISSGSGAERAMGQTWREAGVLRVERRAPLLTASAKVLHLRLDRSGAPAVGSTSGGTEG